MKTSKQDQAASLDNLRTILKPGSTVYTVLKHVSASGMSRRITLLAAVDGEIRNLSFDAARAMGYPVKTRSGYVQEEGITVSGCGQDMGYHLVYGLSQTLFPDGFAPSEIGIRPLDGKRVNVNIGRGKNAGPLTKAEIDKDVAKGWKFPGGRNGDESGWDTDGGYALKHRWI